jgi:hypothetical protein
MPLRNRVTPTGEIVAVVGRGTLMGNRGILHDAHQRIVRDYQVRRWIACRLEFHGRHRQVMQPGSYTELFFLDEAAALAEGHRPCAECRHSDYRTFQSVWQALYPGQPSSADAMDAVLHAERRVRPWVKRTWVTALETLPTGAYIHLEDRAWLVSDQTLLAWAPDGYVDRMRKPDGEVTVLTPPSVVGVLRLGYTPQLHPDATR